MIETEYYTIKPFLSIALKMVSFFFIVKVNETKQKLSFKPLVSLLFYETNWFIKEKRKLFPFWFLSRYLTSSIVFLFFLKQRHRDK